MILKKAFKSDLPVSFLLGVGRLGENFSLTKACKSEAGTVLNLEAKKPDPNLQEFYLLVDRDKQIPIGAKIVDFGGNETSISFQDVELNTALEDSKFSFDIPRGTDVIDQRISGRNKILR